MADEEQNEQTEETQQEETPEETVSAPEGPVAPAAGAAVLKPATVSQSASKQTTDGRRGAGPV